jgi:hypothetical protein
VPRSLLILKDHNNIITHPFSQPFMPHSLLEEEEERSTTIPSLSTS